MFSPLVNLVNDLAFGPDKRKVKQYLDTTTRETVYSDLGKALASQLRSFKAQELLRTTFDKYAIEVPAGRKFWTEESFRSHIRNTYSDAVISDAAVRLLWRSFNFYAHHPFPTPLLQLRHVSIDFDAFQRAVLLTAFQSDELLGTCEFDWHWREDAAFFRRAGFARMFSSIAQVSISPEPQQQVDAGAASAFSDAMDVLVMVCPLFINAVPSQAQLEPVVKRLFAEGLSVVRQQLVRHDDLSTLVDLLVRLQLHQQKWSSSYYFGDIVKADCGNQGITAALVDFLASNTRGENVTVQHLSEAIDFLPNILLRFQHLWTILFQPTESTTITESPLADVKLAGISGAISLFAPQIELGRGGQRNKQQDTRITLEVASQATQHSEETTTLRPAWALLDASSAHVVLFTTGVNVTPKTIVGGYFPSSLEESAHVLFQLQPTFRLLHWAKTKVSLVDLIKTEVKLPTEGTVASAVSNSPYWIGDPMELGTGLRINPEKKTVSLIKGAEGCYAEVPVSSGKDNTNKRWDVTIQDARLDMFVIAGAGVNKKS
ncbi:hypothetical protein GGR51DRAFT_540308 [Nemania sp. FL0031]|nr:hypothetical protein GGR51DRAFT_540308 [Nemania sp. FL0031]